MRIKRILMTLILAMMVFSTGFVVLCGRDKEPKMEQQCKIDLGQDRVTDVKEYGEDGFLCLINGTELRLMAYNGEVLDSLPLDEEVTLLATDDDKAACTHSETPTYDGGFIVAICGGKNVCVLEYIEAKDSLELKMRFSLENAVVSTSVRDSIAYIVLDNGDLYGFEIPRLAKIEPGLKDVESSVDLKLVCRNAKFVGAYNVVLKDNSYMDIYQYNTGNPYEPFGEEIIGVANILGGGKIITSQAIYKPVLPTDIRKMQQIDNGQVYAGGYGYFYVKNGKFYYTGSLNIDPRGEHSPYGPEAKQARVDIPSGYKYCCIYRGIVCYDEHTIICYFV